MNSYAYMHKPRTQTVGGKPGGEREDREQWGEREETYVILSKIKVH